MWGQTRVGWVLIYERKGEGVVVIYVRWCCEKWKKIGRRPVVILFGQVYLPPTPPPSLARCRAPYISVIIIIGSSGNNPSNVWRTVVNNAEPPTRRYHLSFSPSGTKVEDPSENN
ncbi:hypothetical protein ABEB36_001944 [Hypothenemus hampei]|uniref:Uncharacterized protein n=1 Tax=Hypothenemus hampei TaxID=57062 RepID=A0ABD1FG83_HYPHA